MATAQIRVRIGADEIARLARAYKATGKDDVAFAIALALSNLAWAARGHLVADLPEAFTIRTNWTERGFRVEKATKKSLIATIGNVRGYMALQSDGGEKRARGKAMGVPLPGYGRKTKESVLRPRDWPSRLLARKQKPRYFRLFMKSKNQWGIFRRERRGKGSRYPIHLYYVLSKSVHVTTRWKQHRKVREIVRKDMLRVFEQAFARALAIRMRKAAVAAVQAGVNR